MVRKLVRVALRGWRKALRIVRSRQGFIECGGILLTVKSDAISDTMFEILRSGAYERPERDLLERHLSMDDQVLEIGAGIGYLAISAIRTKGIRRYALVEANQSLVALIHKNILLNGLNDQDFEVIRGIVSDKIAIASLAQATNFWAGRIEPSESGERTLSLNDVISQVSFRPNVLILDIEGAECDLNLSNFNDFRKIFIEVHPSLTGHDGACDVLMRLVRLGFEIRDFREATYYLERKFTGQARGHPFAARMTE